MNFIDPNLYHFSIPNQFNNTIMNNNNRYDWNYHNNFEATLPIEIQLQQQLSESIDSLSFQEMQIQYQRNFRILSKLIQMLKDQQYPQQLHQKQQQPQISCTNGQRIQQNQPQTIQQEQIKHPCGPLENLKFKAKMCRTWERTGYCSYADKCQFAHGIEELNEWTQRRRLMILAEQKNIQPINNQNENEQNNKVEKVSSFDENENDNKFRKRINSFSTCSTGYSTDVESETDIGCNGRCIEEVESESETESEIEADISKEKEITTSTNMKKKSTENEIHYYKTETIFTIPILDLEDTLYMIRNNQINNKI